MFFKTATYQVMVRWHKTVYLEVVCEIRAGVVVVVQCHWLAVVEAGLYELKVFETSVSNLGKLWWNTSVSTYKYYAILKGYCKMG